MTKNTLQPADDRILFGEIKEYGNNVSFCPGKRTGKLQGMSDCAHISDEDLTLFYMTLDMDFDVYGTTVIENAKWDSIFRRWFGFCEAKSTGLLKRYIISEAKSAKIPKSVNRISFPEMCLSG